MKIGVLTFWDSKENYGQLLQCFALQKFLRNMGHNPFLIRYRGQVVHNNKSILFKSFSYIVHFPAYFRYACLLLKEKKNKKFYDHTGNQKRNFEGFLDKNIQVTAECYTRKELFENPPVADAYICGSDQIWGGEDVYYLPFAPSEKKIIAYAPSFGGVNTFSEEYKKMLKENLARFDFLGIREQSGVDFCQSLGFTHSVKVVDPTLLLSSSDYDSIRIETNCPKPYIFLYLLGNPCACKVSEIYRFAKENGLNIIYVASQNQNDKYEKVYPQIGEWLDYLAKSEFVITNSFHCTVFSLIYKKKFMTIPLVGAYRRMNTRINELLSISKLDYAIYQGKIKSVFNADFDFSQFDKYKEIEMKKSRSYLVDLLNK